MNLYLKIEKRKKKYNFFKKKNTNKQKNYLDLENRIYARVDLFLDLRDDDRATRLYDCGRAVRRENHGVQSVGWCSRWHQRTSRFKDEFLTYASLIYSNYQVNTKNNTAVPKSNLCVLAYILSTLKMHIQNLFSTLYSKYIGRERLLCKRNMFTILLFV